MTSTNSTQDPARPNLLLISTDQQRFDTLRAYGNEHVHTPNLDRLAGQGVVFENCYVQNPVCAPSRASLMTSRYPHAHGLWANGVELPDDEQFFTRTLADSGYDCGLVGKLHLAACQDGRLERRHDDGFRVFRWAHDPYRGSSENQYHRWLKVAFPDLYAQALQSGTNGGFDNLPTEAHYSHWIGNETIDFLRSSRDRSKPFCFVTNFFDPHHGFGAPREYLDRYRADDLPRPVTRPGELDGKPAILAEASKESYGGHARGYVTYSEDELQEVKASYYAMITLIDDEVGRILDALEEEGLADNTVVVFTSDHGEMLGDHQLMLKGPMMYEGAVHVPLIVRWPEQLPAGERRPELVQWIDLAPTLLEAAGAPQLPRGQGMSLLPIARGDDGAPTRGWALCEYRNSGHPYDPAVHTTMVRAEDWKLVAYHGAPATDRDRSGELYDLSSDPNELVNLWDDPQHHDVRLRLQELLLDILVATEDRSRPRQAHY